jgi:hypothetical protein
MLVVMHDVLIQNRAQVPCPGNQHPVRELGPNCPHPAFSKSIAPHRQLHPTRMIGTGAPEPDHLRKALYGWAFNVKHRELSPSATLAKTITWVERNTVPLADLAEPDTLRRVLNHPARKQDGTLAAATVVARKRAVLFNLLSYAVDKKHFLINPLASVSWRSPKIAEAIDRRRVVNPRQAQALLDAVATCLGRSPRRTALNCRTQGRQRQAGVSAGWCCLPVPAS